MISITRAERAAAVHRPARDLDDDHLPWRGAKFVARRDLHVHQQPLVERRHVLQPVFLLVEAADRGRSAPLEDADDASFGPAVAAVTLDAHEDAIAVHRVVQVVAGDVDIAGHLVDRLVELDESKAVRVHGDAPGREVHQFGHAEMAATCFNQRTAIDQGLEGPPDTRGLRLLELQRPHQLLHCRRMRHALANAV